MTIELKPVSSLDRGRRAKGLLIAGTYEAPAPTGFNGPVTPEVYIQAVVAAWQDGFAAGWAVRDGRDDEPTGAGVTVWVRMNSGNMLVAISSHVQNSDVPQRWRVTGYDRQLTWADLLDDAEQWGLMKAVGP